MKIEHKVFVESYIIDWNATRAYQVAYPNVGYDTAKVNGCKLLTNANIQEYIVEIQDDLEKQAGVSRLKVLREQMKLAFSSIANLHNTWIDRKDFEDLTDEQKACISEISTQVRTVYEYDPEADSKKPIKVEFVKIKLYDKLRALESINKMLGYNEPDRLDHTNDGEPFDIEVFIVNGKNKTKKKN